MKKSTPLLLLFLTLFLSAHAQTYRRINSNQIEVFSNSNETDISVKRGSTISITATGQIRLGAFAGVGDADGIDGLTTYNKVSGFRHGALLGRVGDGSWFLIGKSSSFVADRDGTLSLIVNDADASNNAGSFNINYTIKSGNYSSLKSQRAGVSSSKAAPAKQSEQSPYVYRVIYTHSSGIKTVFVSQVIKVDKRYCVFKENKWKCGEYGYEAFRSTANLLYDMGWEDTDGIESATFDSFNSANKVRDEVFERADELGYVLKTMTIF